MNVNDLNDIMMAGNAMFEEWMTDIEAEHIEPQMVLMAAMAVMAAPPEVISKLPPEVLAAIEQLGISRR